MRHRTAAAAGRRALAGRSGRYRRAAAGHARRSPRPAAGAERRAGGGSAPHMSDTNRTLAALTTEEKRELAKRLLREQGSTAAAAPGSGADAPLPPAHYR